MEEKMAKPEVLDLESIAREIKTLGATEIKIGRIAGNSETLNFIYNEIHLTMNLYFTGSKNMNIGIFSKFKGKEEEVEDYGDLYLSNYKEIEVKTILNFISEYNDNIKREEAKVSYEKRLYLLTRMKPHLEKTAKKYGITVKFIEI